MPEKGANTRRYGTISITQSVWKYAEMNRVSTFLTIIFIGFCVGLLMSIGQPVPFGVVTSDSMSPTLTQGDIYLGIPPMLTDVTTGDIIVFEGEDGWTVHRVVESTPEGYLTKGDANPFTDQATGVPPVPHHGVVASIPEWGGRPLALSGLPVQDDLTMTAIITVGIITIILSVDTGRSVRAPSPRSIGALAASIPVLGWLLGGVRSPPHADTELVNAGLVPIMAVLHREVTSPDVVILWPRQRVDLTEYIGYELLVGVGHPGLVERFTQFDPLLGIIMVSSSTGLFMYAIAHITATILPPAPPRR